MADDNSQPATRSRTRKAPQRRSYMADCAAAEKKLTDLQSRVDMAVRILRKALGDGSKPATADLVAVALETLEAT